MTRKVKGIIFDVDGVISDTAKFHYAAWRDTVKTLGIDFTPEQNLPLKGLPRLDTLVAILKIHGQADKFSTEQLHELTRVKNETYVSLLEKELNASDILPGVFNFIRDAKKAGLKLAVASTSVNSPAILRKFGVLGYFNFIVDPKTVKKGKPNPEIFLKACEGLRLQPADVIGIEDALPGIEALNEAKIRSVAITHGDAGDWSSATLILENTSQLELGFVLDRIA